ncbi:uncharacterized protein LOC111698144 [Eurytemora carolleeae]|uniref:uncharacterized protein LOC111698144 n=1 Tax=Eurytemora carolleeae TaxID=1294199 RepID=UPI000C7763DE|nr:uncharacterized protein LOC111698144 [Eurytemora carolleeae]|eukprot:XP_023324170.1 uncharacterized protein LOC111698144 [Eurytemora affinis]
MKTCSIKEDNRTLDNFITISKQFKADVNSCLLPCSVTLIGLELFSYKDLADLPYSTPSLNLTVLMPNMIRVTKAEYIYTIWEFISEFCGWFGILFGFCVVDLADAIISTIVNLNSLLYQNII